MSWLRATSLSSKLLRVRSIASQRKLAVTDSATKLQQFQSRQVEIRSLLDSLDIERSQLIKSAMDAGAAKVELEVGKLSNEIEALRRERAEAVDYVDKIRQILPTLEQMNTSQEGRIAQLEGQIVSLQGKLDEYSREKDDLVTSTIQDFK